MTDPTSPRPAPTVSPEAKRPKKSIVELIGRLPELVTELIQREIDLIKAEVVEKLKSLGAGVGLLVGAVVVLMFFIGVLLSLAIIGLSYVLPAWAAALIVAGVLLLIAVILGLVGYRILKTGMPPVPTESLASIQKDIHAIRGVGKRVTR